MQIQFVLCCLSFSFPSLKLASSIEHVRTMTKRQTFKCMGGELMYFIGSVRIVLLVVDLLCVGFDQHST